MSKQIKLLFNSSGVLTSTQADQIRQGDANINLVASFEGKSNINYVARYTLTRPDGKIAKGLMNNSSTVTDFEKVLDSAYYFAVKGAVTLTIFLFGNGQVVASGQTTISVEQTDFSEETTITPDEYNELMDEIAKKLNITNGFIVSSELPDPDDHQVGQYLFNTTDNNFYELTESEGEKSWTENNRSWKKLETLYVANSRFNLPLFSDGQLVYFKDSGTLERWDASNSRFVLLEDVPTMADDIENIKEEIQHIKDKSDVVDVVGTYADLEDYDTSDLGDNDLIKVLSDSTHDNKKTYYRYSKSTDSFTYVGAETELTEDDVEAIVAEKASKVSVSSTGTATDEINYITIDGVQKKIAGSGGTGAVSSVNGKTGEVVLDGNDIRVNGSGSALMKDYLGQLREDTDGNTERIDDVEDDLDNVREVAEGKCKTYVISYLTSALTEQYFLDGGIVYKTNGDIIDNWSDFNEYVQGQDIANSFFNSQSDFIDIDREYILTEENVVILADPTDESIKTGDIILVRETNVPDRWVELGSQSIYYNKLETSKVDLTNYVDLTSAQTISGVKTFSDWLQAYGGIKLSSTNKLLASGSYGIYTNETFYPNVDNSKDLGTSSLKWKDLYLSGKIYGNTGVADIDLSGGGIAIGRDLYTGVLRPRADGLRDIGTSSFRYKDLYLSGKLSDGTNEITITNIQAKGSVQTSAEATFSGSLTSNNEYQFTTPLTSLNITQLIVASGDTMPRWEINFVAGSNFTITSLGQDISWKYGEPTFETGEEYTIYIKGNYAYLI